MKPLTAAICRTLASLPPPPSKTARATETAERFLSLTCGPNASTQLRIAKRAYESLLGVRRDQGACNNLAKYIGSIEEAIVETEEANASEAEDKKGLNLPEEWETELFEEEEELADEVDKELADEVDEELADEVDEELADEVDEESDDAEETANAHDLREGRKARERCLIPPQCLR
eukprot:scaffold1311_cov256-Pinguiococcus_pyrenoidosus.AAC.31